MVSEIGVKYQGILIVLKHMLLLSTGMLEQGIVNKDPQGFLGDLLQFLLSAIFIEEEEERQSAGAEKSLQTGMIQV